MTLDLNNEDPRIVERYGKGDPANRDDGAGLARPLSDRTDDPTEPDLAEIDQNDAWPRALGDQRDRRG